MKPVLGYIEANICDQILILQGREEVGKGGSAEVRKCGIAETKLMEMIEAGDKLTPRLGTRAEIWTPENESRKACKNNRCRAACFINTGADTAEVARNVALRERAEEDPRLNAEELPRA